MSYKAHAIILANNGGSAKASSHDKMVRFLICTKGRISRISRLMNIGCERKSNKSCFGLSKRNTKSKENFGGG